MRSIVFCFLLGGLNMRREVRAPAPLFFYIGLVFALLQSRFIASVPRLTNGASLLLLLLLLLLLRSQAALAFRGGAALLRRGSSGSRSSMSSSIIGGRQVRPRVRRLRASSVRMMAKVAAEDTEATKANGFSYSDTVILMDTQFNQRANAVVREPELQEFWEKSKIYESLRESAEARGAAKYVLHDGPPYANGDLHIGHALNKILKDFINRYQMIQGKYVEYIPGWDCHGLPIELKVLQSMKSKERQGLTPVDLRKKAAAFAQETVGKQMDSFKRYGVWADWDQPYLTLQPEYEAAQIEVFGKMFLKGHIYRGRKPVHWSPSSRTALAEAELEYPEGHTSQSIYVAFDAETVSPCLEEFGPEGLRIAIWTTTPWTIPANLAVAVNSKLDYSVVEAPESAGGGRLLVATDLIGSLAAKLGLAEGEALKELATFKGSELTSGTTYKHPLAGRTSMVVEGGDYITTESGTGLVHTAPGHGQEDYQTGLKYGLELLSPVDDGGRFTEEAGEAFAGLNVLGDGNEAVIEALRESGNLLSVDPYLHKYPYDWRTKKPTIFRATDQWFASVDNFRDDAMAAIDSVKWMPEFGKNRISAMTSSRADWCISRQRTWGVPIPVFYQKETGEALMTEETIAHVTALVREKGSDAWFELDEADLLPPSLAADADQWQKGTDTMDVWFDSGSSWSGVVNARPNLSFPADLYLEGSDQHRGWFQSSLLTSVASEGVAPYKNVLTHGFVLDEKGIKMSKSIGNVVDPLQVIEGGNNKKKNPAYGADVLRLWVASVDYTSDVCIGDNIIKQVRGWVGGRVGGVGGWMDARCGFRVRSVRVYPRLLLLPLFVFLTFGLWSLSLSPGLRIVPAHSQHGAVPAGQPRGLRARARRGGVRRHGVPGQVHPGPLQRRGGRGDRRLRQLPVLPRLPGAPPLRERRPLELLPRHRQGPPLYLRRGQPPAPELPDRVPHHRRGDGQDDGADAAPHGRGHLGEPTVFAGERGPVRVPGRLGDRVVPGAPERRVGAHPEAARGREQGHRGGPHGEARGVEPRLRGDRARRGRRDARAARGDAGGVREEQRQRGGRPTVPDAHVAGQTLRLRGRRHLGLRRGHDPRGGERERLHHRHQEGGRDEVRALLDVHGRRGQL
jgi:isoleucyl-tRNA synthetase